MSSEAHRCPAAQEPSQPATSVKEAKEKIKIATLPVLRSVPEILETERVSSWRLKESEPRDIPRKLCKPEA